MNQFLRIFRALTYLDVAMLAKVCEKAKIFANLRSDHGTLSTGICLELVYASNEDESSINSVKESSFQICKNFADRKLSNLYDYMPMLYHSSAP